MPEIDPKWGVETWLSIELLVRRDDYRHTETEYQREVRPERVQAISEDFACDAFGRPHVVLRKDGTYIVLDGYHRVEAAMIVGESHIPCLVFANMSLADEAMLYVRLNRDRARVSPISQFHAECISGDVMAVELDAMLLRHKLDGRGLDRAGTTPFTAISPTKAAYRFGGIELLDLAFTSMHDAFTPPGKKAWWGNTRIVQGVTEFFATTRVSPKPTRDEFIVIVRDEFVTPDALWQAAVKTHGRMGGGTGGSGRRENDAVVVTLLNRLRRLRRTQKQTA